MKGVAAMSSIIYITNKDTGKTYAYESWSYWDKTAKAPRSHRTYLGRVADDGTIIPKKQKKDSQSPDGSMEYKKLYEQTAEENKRLKSEVARLKRDASSFKKLFRRLKKLADLQNDCLDTAIQLTNPENGPAGK